MEFITRWFSPSPPSTALVLAPESLQEIQAEAADVVVSNGERARASRQEQLMAGRINALPESSPSVAHSEVLQQRAKNILDDGARIRNGGAPHAVQSRSASWRAMDEQRATLELARHEAHQTLGAVLCEVVLADPVAARTVLSESIRQMGEQMGYFQNIPSPLNGIFAQPAQLINANRLTAIRSASSAVSAPSTTRLSLAQKEKEYEQWVYSVDVYSQYITNVEKAIDKILAVLTGLAPDGGILIRRYQLEALFNELSVPSEKNILYPPQDKSATGLEGASYEECAAWLSKLGGSADIYKIVEVHPGGYAIVIYDGIAQMLEKKLGEFGPYDWSYKYIYKDQALEELRFLESVVHSSTLMLNYFKIQLEAAYVAKLGRSLDDVSNDMIDAIGAIETGYLDVYLNALEVYTEFYDKLVKEVVSQLSACITANTAAGKEGDIIFDTKKFIHLLDIVEAYYFEDYTHKVPKETAVLFPPQIKGGALETASQAECEAWAKEFGLPPNCVKPSGSGYVLVLDMSPVRQMIQSIYDSVGLGPAQNVQASKYSAWETGFNALLAQVEHRYQMIVNGASNAQSTVDSLYKLLTESIKSMYQALRQFFQ
ncbi:IpaD/SipD/SspD family type III secretion system needle tip protein [Chromobacterium piscinae]|uniref:Translocator protein BipD n=1 Tax=Chromobacterium piscinae TaxID=686831 RepID=A0ABV0H9A8_9NEIS